MVHTDAAVVDAINEVVDETVAEFKLFNTISYMRFQRTVKAALDGSKTINQVVKAGRAVLSYKREQFKNDIYVLDNGLARIQDAVDDASDFHPSPPSSPRPVPIDPAMMDPIDVDIDPEQAADLDAAQYFAEMGNAHILNVPLPLPFMPGK